mmetsp:Transcript_41021/g.62073  ORF Transcript_41021/g.62073 Transcript_41021/m.62073 type:complete len:256 (-) Transcript_41021:138-905(-)
MITIVTTKAKKEKRIMPHAIPTYMNQDQIVKRAIQVPFSPEPMPLGPVPTPDEIVNAGGTFVDTGTKEYFIPCNDIHHRPNGKSFFYLSGEIPRVTPYETGLNYHYTYDTNEEKWKVDTLVKDERFLAVYLKHKGLIVFSSCSHAGIVNVVKHATDKFNAIIKVDDDHDNNNGGNVEESLAASMTVPVYAVVGGFHLSGRDKDPIIPDTVSDLKHVPYIVPGHCTGFRAVNAFLNAYGDDRVIPAATGKVITWKS